MYHNLYVTHAVKTPRLARFESHAMPPFVFGVATLTIGDVTRPSVRLSFYRSLGLESIISIWNVF
jgi:hypothetical protein